MNNQIQFFCSICNKDIDKCKCKDLSDRFMKNFTGSVLEDRVYEIFHDKSVDRVVA